MVEIGGCKERTRSHKISDVEPFGVWTDLSTGG
jgi:hypothetical protein